MFYQHQNIAQIRNKILHFNQRNKRFKRKRSESNQKYTHSRKQSIQQFVNNHYIRSPSQSKHIITTQQNSFFKKLAQTYTPKSINNQHSNKKTPTKQNYVIKFQVLETEMEIMKNKFENVTIENENLKKYYNEEKQKTKLLQSQKKSLEKQLVKAQKESQLLKLQLKTLVEQNQNYIKEIQQLQKMNFDDKTRLLQSSRQKYLEKQLSKLRKQLKRGKGERQRKLETQITQLKNQQYTLQSHFKALTIQKDCLLKQIKGSLAKKQQIKTQQEKILFTHNSDQYSQLKLKYHKILDQYKSLRIEYWKLKYSLNIQNQSSILNITQSSCGQQINFIQLQ